MTIARITDHYIRPADIESIAKARADSVGSELYAGGTDLIPLTRGGVLVVDTLIDIKSTEIPSGIGRSGDTWEIGALATLAQLEDHAELGKRIPAIGQAARMSATRQIRNRATVGGNLLQRPRCSYFRDSEIDCWMKGGDECPAKVGRNEHHGLVDGECIATQPSDLASVLVAFVARVELSGPAGERSVDVSDLLAAPMNDRRSLHALGEGEVVRRIVVDDDPGRPGRRSTYVKAMDRAVWQFALVGVAAVVEVDGSDVVTAARLVASGIASTPHVLTGAAESLVGRPLDSRSIDRAAGATAYGLTPFSENAYKLPLLDGLTRRALQNLA